MKNLSRVFIASIGLYFILLFAVFYNWFSLNPLSGGDWEYYFSETLREFPILPSSWNIWFGMGFGVNLTFFMNISSYFMSTTSIYHNFFRLPWVLIERLFWFWPFLLFSSYFSYRLSRVVFPDIKKHYSIIASAIYTLNTYSLMLVGGGQMGVALSYAVAPLTLALFMGLMQAKDSNRLWFRSIIFGLIFSFQLLLDIRIAYVTLFLLGLFFVWQLLLNRKNLVSISKLLVFVVLVPGIITFSLHLWWVLPFVFSSKDPLSSLADVYVNAESVKFFSFSSFSHAFSLLQPNWPENIFGKTSFLKTEFLILPLLAFVSMLFIKKDKNRTNLNILFFAVSSLVAIFLAKGANEHAGEIYIWLFNNVPGFYMFRDPTKWYVIIALCYSVLIPFSIYEINQFLATKVKDRKLDLVKVFLNGFLLLVGIYLISPALTGQTKGTFMARTVPQEYIDYKDFILKDQTYGRVMWVPQENRYSFYNSLHPNTDAKDFFDTSDPKELVTYLAGDESRALMEDSSIEYIAVPSDPYGEIFLEDRKYSQEIKDYYDKQLEEIFSDLKSEKFGEITVYSLLAPRDLFSSADSNIFWTQDTWTHYSVSSEKPFSSLTFTASFDPDWKAVAGGREYSSQKLQDKFNIFNFPESVSSVEVIYSPQKWVGRGLIWGIVVLLSCFFVLLRFRKN